MWIKFWDVEVRGWIQGLHIRPRVPAGPERAFIVIKHLARSWVHLHHGLLHLGGMGYPAYGSLPTELLISRYF